jgi:hypothetical protein
MGKTYAAKNLAEEFVKAKLPFVVLDPLGAWWGLRLDADGKRKGLPITILGGDYGDLPLEPTIAAGTEIAEFVVERPGHYLLDLSSFKSDAEQDRFAEGFATRLFRVKQSRTKRQPVMVFVDEADAFAPQQPMHGQEKMLGAYRTLMRRGRLFGIGMVAITQRPAALNKNVLTQAEMLIVGQVTGSQDRQAIDLWVKEHATEDQRAEFLKSMAGLQKGEMWFWSPSWLRVFEQVRIRKAETFDSSKTPEPDEQLPEPVPLDEKAKAALEKRLAATIERAKQEDPDELHKEIRRLKAELVKRPTETKVEKVMERFEVPIFRDGEVSRLEKAVGALADFGAELQVVAKEIGGAMRAAATVKAPVISQKVPSLAREPRPRVHISQVETDEPLGKGERTVLTVLAQWPEGRTHSELAFLAGYSSRASTLGVILAKLRRVGYVAPDQPIRLTPEGAAAVGGYEELPTGAGLLDHWLRHPRMGEGERKVLRVLIDVYPEALSHDELCEATGYSPGASTIGVILAKLRKLGLVEKGQRRVASEFMEAIA